jgi:hypothetical protein
MSKYRCPICGSPHKEPVSQCRQCGANLSEGSQVPIITRAPRSGEVDRLQPRSIAPFILGGLALVVILAIGAVAMGLVETGDEVDTVRAQVGPAGGDGWIEFQEPNGVFTAEMPGEPEVVATETPLTATGTTTRYVKEVNDELTVEVAYTDGAALDTNDPYAALNAVTITLRDAWQGWIYNLPIEGSVAGQPSLDFVIDEITINSVPYEIYGRLIMLEDGDIILISTLAHGGRPDQHNRILENFIIGLPAEES